MKLEAKSRLLSAPAGSKETRAAWLLEKVDPSMAQYKPPTSPAQGKVYKDRILELMALEADMSALTLKAWNKLKKSSALVRNLISDNS